MQAKEEQRKRMLGVHTVSEFVFCPRAGVISYELRNDDFGVDTGFVDLSYSPDYDIILARLEYENIGRRFQQFSFGLLGATLTTIILALAVKPFLGFLSLLVLIPSAVFLSPRLYRDFILSRHLKKQLILHAKARKQRPKLDDPKPEIIPWYSLLKSCDVEKCHELLVDEELGIKGKPWKLLHHGDVCLPVFFCRKPTSASDSETNPIAWLKKQHSVRMKAYCHLIEQNTGKHSSCGIIVFAGTMDAVAIKFWKSRVAERELEDALVIARQTLDEFDQYEKVGVPAANVCIRCHLGRPKVYRLEPGVAYRNGNSVRPLLHEAKVDGRPWTLHSVCGDLFEWVPPHEKASEYKIKKRESVDFVAEQKATASQPTD